MLVRIQWVLLWCANGACDYWLVHWPLPIVLLEQLIFLPIIFCPQKGVIDVANEELRRRRKLDRWLKGSSRPKPAPPPGFTGPFWNKPSHASLQADALPFSVAQSRIVLLVLLIPFGALAYLLLR